MYVLIIFKYTNQSLFLFIEGSNRGSICLMYPLYLLQYDIIPKFYK